MEIQTFSPLQAEMLILLGNIEQYAEQGRQLFSGPQSHCLSAGLPPIYGSHRGL